MSVRFLLVTAIVLSIIYMLGRFAVILVRALP